METRCLCCLSVGSWKWRRTGSLHFALADQTQTQGLEKKMHTPFVQRKEQKDKCGFHTYSLKPLYLWFSEKNEGMNQILFVLLFCIFKKAVFEESVKMSYLLIEKRPRKTKGRVLQRNRRHCNLRALMWLLKTTVSFSSLPTSSWVKPMSNLKPGKTAGLGAEFRENGKAEDFLWEVPWSGESPGLKLKCQD